MAKEYAIYPFRYMNISQRHDQGNHTAHWKNSKTCSDKPWDEACKDSGRSYFEPQNDFVVEEVKGLNTTSVTNSVRLKSVNKLYIPYKKDPDYLCLTLTHMNEDNLKQVKKGQILKKGTKILMEGTDGLSTGNHFHITANIGKYHGLLENSNGKWCWVYDKSLLPNEAFYLYKDYTNVKNANKYSFKEVPKEIVKVGTPVPKDNNNHQVQVLVPELHVRNKPTINGTVLGFANIGIYDIIDSSEADGYIWYEIEKNKWIASKEDVWTKFYEREDVVEPPKNDLEQTEVENGTITPSDTETGENDPKDEEIGVSEDNTDEKFSIWDKIRELILEIINLLKKK